MDEAFNGVTTVVENEAGSSVRMSALQERCLRGYKRTRRQTHMIGFKFHRNMSPIAWIVKCIDPSPVTRIGLFHLPSLSVIA